MPRALPPLPRQLFGYQSAAVRSALLQTDHYYLAEADRLTAQLQEIRRTCASAQIGVALAEEAMDIAEAALGPLPRPEPGEAPRTGRDAFPFPPPILRFRRALLGVKPAAAEHALQELVVSWEGKIAALLVEVAATEADEKALFARLDQVRRRLAAAREVQQLSTPDREERHGALILLRPGHKPGPRPGIARRRGPAPQWRPGMIEEVPGPLPRPRTAGIETFTLPVAGAARTPVPLDLPPVRPTRATAETVAAPVAVAAAAAFSTQPFEPQPAEQVRPAVPESDDPDAAKQLSHGVGARITQLYNRFLAGKVLGTDLYLPTGELLAARSTPITLELTSQAELGGVLPALIANMTIPGLAER